MSILSSFDTINIVGHIKNLPFCDEVAHLKFMWFYSNSR